MQKEHKKIMKSEIQLFFVLPVNQLWKPIQSLNHFSVPMMCLIIGRMEGMNNDEIRAQLQSYLQQGGPQAQLTISSTTFDGPNIAALLNTYYAGNTLVIQNAVMQPADGGSTQTTVCGTAPFMNVEKAPVCATFQEAQNGVDLILKYQLPPTWRFSQSFP